MTCDRWSDILIDYAYGELPDAEGRQVEEHLQTCDACRSELARLRLGRSALARLGAPDADTFARRCEALLKTPPRRALRRWRWLAPSAAAAVLLVAAGVLLLLQTGHPPVQAAIPPVEIRRVGVSLTILSQPQEWRAGWEGLALVRDQRLAVNLPKGRSAVRFAGVPWWIRSDSVRLRSLDIPDGMTILEQNYQYDIANADAVLKKYVDKKIHVNQRLRETASGRLLSFDGTSLVIQPDGGGPRTIARQEVESIAFEKLPEGLLTEPALAWELENRAAARQRFEVSYLTQGIQWRADYVLKLRNGVGGHGREGERELPVVFDTADLVGYATVTNHSGVTYENAQLKLLAGDVNLIQPPRKVWEETEFLTRVDVSKLALPVTVFTEKSFFEYHLYTLGRPTTIGNAETKQMELVSGSGIRMRRGYVYDPQVDESHAVRVVSEFKNSQDNGLGKPLPKGWVRLYAPDPEGVDGYVSQMQIDHTARDETVRLKWGYAFDLAASRTRTQYRCEGDVERETWEYDLRNHKGYAVTVTVVVRVDASTYEAACNLPWHVRKVGLVEVDVPVKANGREKVTFSRSWNRNSGGGLKSPHDEKRKETEPATPKAVGEKP